MRFIDETIIHILSGAGGNGCGSFRREKFVPFGGPDGGDGGKGGNVVLVATHRRTTLLKLRNQRLMKAGRGAHGRGKQQTGAAGDSIEIAVPVGTRIFDSETGEILADLVEHDQQWVGAKGGRGGLGNLHFKTNTNRSPRKTTPGQPGEERRLRLELMLMADVGLLGFPNAGKSTLISRVSAAKPKVADYPFTTLAPSLGMVDMGIDGSFAIADIPGLVEGASDGAGLGLQFLRHVSRTRLLAHLVSMGEHDEGVVMGGNAETSDALRRYRAIRKELATYDTDLAERPEVVVLTKADIVEPEVAEGVRAQFEAETGRPVFVVSSATGLGISSLINDLWIRVQDLVEE